MLLPRAGRITFSAMPGPSVSLAPGRGGLPTVSLVASDGARAEVALHGAHVLSWRPAAGEERLFLSARSAFRDGTAIRGGVPVIFPQFADRGPYARHGFARTRAWSFDEGAVRVDAAGRAQVTLRLDDDADTRARWPYAFAAELTVSVGGDALAVTLTVANPGAAALAFTAALHTYLAVPHVARASVAGLRGVRHLDSTAGGAERVDDAPAVTFAGEVDRIYLDAPATVTLRDGGEPTLEVRAAGFPDVVVWNPGAEKGAALADLEPGGASRFVCVEAAVVGTPVALAPGGRWSGTQTLVVAPSRA